MLRGDHRVNEIKLRNALGARVPARAAGGVRGPDRARRLHRPGRHRRADPARRGRRRRAATSPARTARTRTCAASSPGRDFRVRARRHPHGRGGRHRRRPRRSGSSPRSRSATSSSSARATPSRSARPTSTRPASEQLIWMGSYGHRPGADRRRRRRAVRRRARDLAGRARSRRSTSSWSGSARRARRSARSPSALYDELRETGLDVLYDDRDAGPGAKFADAELLGVPLRLTVGRRTLEAGEVEAQVRRGREQRSAAAARAPRRRRRTCGAASRRARRG